MVAVVNCFQIVSLTYWAQPLPELPWVYIVVNCFQIVSLTYWAQLACKAFSTRKCCELLSDCIFDLLSTTLNALLAEAIMLWIAFRLYLWPTEHNYDPWGVSRKRVVNCFQIVSLTYWAQRKVPARAAPICCELLSDCIFDLLSTT